MRRRHSPGQIYLQDFDAIAGPADGPVGIAYPTSLVARFNALDIGIAATAGIRSTARLRDVSLEEKTLAVWPCRPS